MSDQASDETSSFNEFFGEFSEVPLKNQGTDGDVVVSSRVRLVRNIAAYPFPNTSSDEQRQSTARSVQTCLTKVSDLSREDELVILPSEQLEELERQFLIEFQAVIDARAGIEMASANEDDVPADESDKQSTDDLVSESDNEVTNAGLAEFPFTQLDDESATALEDSQVFDSEQSNESEHPNESGQPSESSDADASDTFEAFEGETVFDLDDESSGEYLTVSVNDDSASPFGENAFDKWNIDGELPEADYRESLLNAMEAAAERVQQSSSDDPSPSDRVPSRNIKTAIVVNEEDHVRLQGMAAGLDLYSVWEEVDRIDDQMEQHLAYAFSPQWGYLTACPANVGTGMRASAVLHLPALATLGRLDQAFRWLIRSGIAGRGLYGEHAWGDFYRIANQPTLGKTEHELLALMQAAVPVIVAYERDARKVMLRHYRDNIEQQVENAFRALKLPVQRSDEELLSLVSSMRLGLSLGLLDQEQIDHIRETFELKRLRQQLEFAVMLEQYGTATKCRDRIRQLEERRHGH